MKLLFASTSKEKALTRGMSQNHSQYKCICDKCKQLGSINSREPGASNLIAICKDCMLANPKAKCLSIRNLVVAIVKTAVTLATQTKNRGESAKCLAASGT